MIYGIVAVALAFIFLVILIVAMELEMIDLEDMIWLALGGCVYSLVWPVTVPLTLAGLFTYGVARLLAGFIKKRRKKNENRSDK